MKFILEINSENEKDIIDAIETLIKIAPKDLSLPKSECLPENENDKLIEPAEDLNFNILDEITCMEEGLENNEDNALKEEIKELKSLIDNLKAEKKKLNEENKSLKDKITSLEDEVGALPSVPNTENMNVELEGYKKKIEHLTKEVLFHESRSNKNFEEVKKLRVTVDNLSSEKRTLEKNVLNLEEELKEAKLGVGEDNGQLDELSKKISELEKNKEKLLKEIEFQKNRSNKNWEDLKALRHEHDKVCKENAELSQRIKESLEDSDNLSNKEEVIKIKSELAQLKSECDSRVGDLQVVNDKLKNELNSYKNKFTEDDLNELIYLRRIKQVICNNDKGAAFWMGVESTLK